MQQKHELWMEPFKIYVFSIFMELNKSIGTLSTLNTKIRDKVKEL